jgi:chemotaxis protein CheD
MRKNLDVIFCRNVIIYFDRPTQQTLLNHLCQHLKPEGYLFMGHSEALTGMTLPLAPQGNTIYRRTGISANAPEIPIITLNPGEMMVTDKPTVIRTVLGSCVAVTMFNRSRGLSAICHALLPQPNNDESYTANYAENYKYVKFVVPEMIRKMRRYGLKNWQIEVKLFGGADMLNEKPGSRLVGTLNVKMVMEVLRQEHLHLKTSDVGGNRGRKILFHTHTGEVLLKRLKGSIDGNQEE